MCSRGRRSACSASTTTGIACIPKCGRASDTGSHRRISMVLVRVDCVSKKYLLGDEEIWALRDVSLRVDAGVFMAIAGPSGSGKSTLLNLIGCIDVPTTGTVC